MTNASASDKPDPSPPETLIETAHRLADLSGPVILQQFRRQPAVEDKNAGGIFDPVTDADRGAERVIRAAIEASYPSHGIIGEEYGIKTGSNGHDWVIDPIDGTRAFIMGSPLWGTLIGLLKDGTPHLGVMDQPFTGERFWSDGTQSYMRRAPLQTPTPIATRSCPALDQAIMATTHPDLFVGSRRAAALDSLKQKVQLTRFGGDCYNYCLLAAGFVDVIIESDLKTYDIAALIPIIEHAGGRITTWRGDPATTGGDILATGDPRLHDVVLEALAS